VRYHFIDSRIPQVNFEFVDQPYELEHETTLVDRAFYASFIDIN
jgi:hypothetical protein